MQVHDKVDTADIVFQSQVADAIMVILPGVTSGLLEVAKGSDVQGHKLTQVIIAPFSKKFFLFSLFKKIGFEASTKILL